jgi:hypothetical protein
MRKREKTMMMMVMNYTVTICFVYHDYLSPVTTSYDSHHYYGKPIYKNVLVVKILVRLLFYPKMSILKGVFNLYIYDNNQEEVIVSIKYTGEGIDPEIQPRLFNTFATRSFTGTGLGLYISKNIIEAHGV